MCFSTRSTAFLAIALGLAIGSTGCAYESSLMAAQAKTRLVGMSELELETCLGLPDKEATKGKTTLLSCNGTSGRTVNLLIPIVMASAYPWRAIAARHSGLRMDGCWCELYRRQRYAGGTKQRVRRPYARLPFSAK
jgi:hypothetical protein